MTLATSSRELTQLIKGILGKYEIDNLALEIELCHAFKSWVDPQRRGRTPGEIRLEIEEALHTGIIRKTKQEEVMGKAERLLLSLSYNLRGATTFEQERLYKHLVSAEKKGQTMDGFVSWAQKDVFWHDKISSVSKIIELWPRAFANQEKASSVEDRVTKFLERR